MKKLEDVHLDIDVTPAGEKKVQGTKCLVDLVNEGSVQWDERQHQHAGIAVIETGKGASVELLRVMAWKQ